MSPDKLAFLAYQSHDKALAAIEVRLRRCWDPRMRAGIVTHPDGDTVRLDPSVQEAVERLTEKRAS
jgi:formate dehydrogenase subunit delta